MVIFRNSIFVNLYSPIRSMPVTPPTALQVAEIFRVSVRKLIANAPMYCSAQQERRMVANMFSKPKRAILDQNVCLISKEEPLPSESRFAMP